MSTPALALTHISPRAPRALHVISGWQREGWAIMPKVTRQISQGAEKRSGALGRRVINIEDKSTQKGH